MTQLVFKRMVTCPFDIAERQDTHFMFISAPLAIVPFLGAIRRILGTVETVKAVLKLASRKRKFYCTLESGRIIHYGWMSISFCRYYRVEQRDVVIGPIWTEERARSRGIGAYALQKAVNEMVKRGYRVFYIDTSEDNISCLKVIEKCGFGLSVFSFQNWQS